MSELIDGMNLDAFHFNYNGFEGSFLPYETLEVLMEDYPVMADWKLKDLIYRVDNQLKKYSIYDEKGFRLDATYRKIKMAGSFRALRPLYYFLMTGLYPVGGVVLRTPEDDPLTLDLDKLWLWDRREASKEASRKYREKVKRIKESVGVGVE